MTDKQTERDHRLTVLYVEDDADCFKLAALRLKDRYRLVRACNDAEACDAVRSLKGQLHAVLVDIELSGSTLDGLDLVRVFRGRHEGPLPVFAREVPQVPAPIVVLTAFIGRYVADDVRAAGADHFITKPIDFTRLNLALAQSNLKSVMQQLTPEPAHA